MELKEIQLIYFLFKKLKNSIEDFNSFKIIVEHNGKLLTSDFLLNDTTHKQAINVTLDEGSDLNFVEPNAEHLTFYREFLDFSKLTTNDIFLRMIRNPFHILNKAMEFTSEKFSELQSNDSLSSFPNTVWNLTYLESNISFEKAYLPEDDYRLVSLEVVLKD